MKEKKHKFLFSKEKKNKLLDNEFSLKIRSKLLVRKVPASKILKAKKKSHLRNVFFG